MICPHHCRKHVPETAAELESDGANTTIGNNCVIAGASVFEPGVKGGNRAEIGSLTLVDRDVAERQLMSSMEEFATLGQRLAQLEQLVSKLCSELSDAYKGRFGA